MMTRFMSLLPVFVCFFGFSCYAGANEDLIAACKSGDLVKVNEALNAGANVNYLQDGNPAITGAFFWPDIVKLLLQKGANPDLGATTALFQASVSYSTEVMKLLLDAGADPNKPIMSDPAVTFKTLIATEKAKGKQANQAMIDAWTNAMATMKPSAVYILPTVVTATNCVPCMEMLFGKGADPSKGLAEGSLIHTFATSGMSREERKAGFALGKKNMESFGLRVPEWYSALPDERNRTAEEMLKVLLSKGLKINEQNKGLNGTPPQTPLELSLNGGLGGREEIALLLIDNGADVKIKSDWYGHVILQAAQCGFAKVVKAMIEKGVDMNTEGKAFTDVTTSASIKTFTPFTAAAMKDRTDVVKYLLGAGAKTEGVSGTVASGPCPGNIEGKSAIFFAIENGNMEMVQFLAEHNGFDGKSFTLKAKKMTNCVGGASYTPSSYAKALGKSDMQEYLKKQGI